jgi:N-acetylneuraminic acid mutarotase
MMSDLKELEKIILSYLESRPPDFKWVKGFEVYDKQKTIELFKKSEEFRKYIIEQVLKLATDLFIRGKGEK